MYLIILCGSLAQQPPTKKYKLSAHKQEKKRKLLPIVQPPSQYVNAEKKTRQLTKNQKTFIDVPDLKFKIFTTKKKVKIIIYTNIIFRYK